MFWKKTIQIYEIVSRGIADEGRWYYHDFSEAARDWRECYSNYPDAKLYEITLPKMGKKLAANLLNRTGFK